MGKRKKPSEEKGWRMETGEGEREREQKEMQGRKRKRGRDGGTLGRKPKTEMAEERA